MKPIFTTVFLLIVFISFSQVPSIKWQKSYGGSNDDEAFSVAKTKDGGSILAGQSTSNDSDVTGNNGKYDCWIVKLDTAGNIEWQKTFGGANDDKAYNISQTYDGGYILIMKWIVIMDIISQL